MEIRIRVRSKRERIESIGLYGQIQLLFQLPNQCVLGRFSQFDFAPGKLP